MMLTQNKKKLVKLQLTCLDDSFSGSMGLGNLPSTGTEVKDTYKVTVLSSCAPSRGGDRQTHK